MAKYMYTTSGKKPDDKFDIEGLQKGSAELRESDTPDKKAMRYADPRQYGEYPKPGAGRGKQGGPTAGELKAKELEDIREAGLKYDAKKQGISVEQLRKNMSDEFDKRMKAGEFYKRGGKVKKMASGGMTSKVSSASSRADGCCTKGKTRGKMY